mmetsp:Transcript_58596/g.107854  ORF Transcript_58596/g.107854 Transcript_58596/m.107854 type:complete len:546 (+) Transcript_58596:71-1708(+)
MEPIFEDMVLGEDHQSGEDGNCHSKTAKVKKIETSIISVYSMLCLDSSRWMERVRVAASISAEWLASRLAHSALLRRMHMLSSQPQDLISLFADEVFQLDFDEMSSFVEDEDDNIVRKERIKFVGILGGVFEDIVELLLVKACSDVAGNIQWAKFLHKIGATRASDQLPLSFSDVEQEEHLVTFLVNVHATTIQILSCPESFPFFRNPESELIFRSVRSEPFECGQRIGISMSFLLPFACKPSDITYSFHHDVSRNAGDGSYGPEDPPGIEISEKPPFLVKATSGKTKQFLLVEHIRNGRIRWMANFPSHWVITPLEFCEVGGLTGFRRDLQGHPYSANGDVVEAVWREPAMILLGGESEQWHHMNIQLGLPLERSPRPLVDIRRGLTLARSPQSFLPNTMIRLSHNNFKTVVDVQVGDVVCGLEGTPAEVILKEQATCMASIVEIITRKGSHKFTANHRIVTVSTNSTLDRLVWVEAGSLNVGDHIRIGDAPIAITKIKEYKKFGEIVELHFDPDVPVETQMISSLGGIFTLGGSFPETPRDGF